MAQDRKYEGLGPITLSIMDRLLDMEPKVRTELQITYKKSLEITRASLRRDLENLLNTRCTEVPLPQGSHQLERSLYMYGLPDITSLSSNYLHDQNRLLLAVEETLRTIRAAFESRESHASSLKRCDSCVAIRDRRNVAYRSCPRARGF